MTTMLEPITEEELLGYMSAMLADGPWGEPVAAVDTGVPVR
jgi:hypothetical protein